MSEHVFFMRRCLELARVAKSQGDSPVGSLIVLQGKILSEGIESVQSLRDPVAHAEIRAIQEACRKQSSTRLPGTTLYTTVEPCWMCSYAVRQARISQVVIGVRNHQVGGASSPYPLLTDPAAGSLPKPPRLVWNVLEADCAGLFD